MGTVMPLGFAVAEKLAAVQDDRGVGAVVHVGDLSYAGIDTGFPRLNFTKDDEVGLHVWSLKNGEKKKNSRGGSGALGPRTECCALASV